MGVKSQIDHFILSENAINMILTYDSLDATNNFSEHFPVKCTIDFNVEYFNSVEHAKSEVTPKPTWYKANDDVINLYIELLDINLSIIPLPQDALLWTNTFCKVHIEQINGMHEHISLALLDDSNNSIPTFKPL